MKIKPVFMKMKLTDYYLATVKGGYQVTREREETTGCYNVDIIKRIMRRVKRHHTAENVVKQWQAQIENEVQKLLDTNNSDVIISNTVRKKGRKVFSYEISVEAVDLSACYAPDVDMEAIKNKAK